MWTAGFGFSWRKTELGIDEWSVACAPLGVIRHKSNFRTSDNNNNNNDFGLYY